MAAYLLPVTAIPKMRKKKKIKSALFKPERDTNSLLSSCAAEQQQQQLVSVVALL